MEPFLENLPALYKRTSTGKIQMWEVAYCGAYVLDNTVGVIVTNYGQLNGKIQRIEETISEGKNIGKANETSPYEQAVAEATSRHTEKRKEGYVETVEEALQGGVDSSVIQGGVAPMLAHVHEKQGHKIKYPAYAQPKLDGHRCIAVITDGKCTLWSRTRKRITGVPHIERALEEIAASHPVKPMSMVLDGELYNHDYKDRFEELSSFIRQEKPKPGHEAVQYWIYDVVIDLPFSERNNLLSHFEALIKAKDLGRTLGVLSTFEVENEDALMSLFAVFLDEGYEGAMVRNANGKYINKRSYDLQKVKSMLDDEFEIVGIEEGRGKMAGKAIFVCACEGGTFNAKLKGKLDDLAQYFENPDEWIGKQLTVQYQGMSNYGIPRFPVGLRIRADV